MEASFKIPSAFSRKATNDEAVPRKKLFSKAFGDIASQSKKTLFAPSSSLTITAPAFGGGGDGHATDQKDKSSVFTRTATAPGFSKKRAFGHAFNPPDQNKFKLVRKPEAPTRDFRETATTSTAESNVPSSSSLFHTSPIKKEASENSETLSSSTIATEPTPFQQLIMNAAKKGSSSFFDSSKSAFSNSNVLKVKTEGLPSFRSRSQSPGGREGREEGSVPSKMARPRPLSPHFAGVAGLAPRPRRIEVPSSAVTVDESNTKPTREQHEILRNLFKLKDRVCTEVYDRFLLLDERDKLLYRLRAESEKNNFPLRKGRTPIIGECPTMCTEKERYVRQEQSRIASFECDENGKVDAAIVVKEYARSAADQEKPLPHELRTRESLKNTMVYLLTQILDRLPANRDDWGGWYNFLWSRTRAIRKEITQLQLSDALAVSLVESCARLHIVCSYLLCELEVEHFDQKMNTENLAKSLQTLRHLYEDLAGKGISCESEAEFRSYDVLLHLDDSNVLNQVLSYRKSVRDSHSVRLSISLASAMRSKNYVRFFRLLKRDATFLQCCVVHRFMNKVRVEGLNTIMQSSTRSDTIQLDYLIRILAFNSKRDALDTLGPLGIALEDDDHIAVSKDIHTNVSIPLRHCDWIDEKKSCNWSGIVYGSPQLPPCSIRSSINSFDASGRYSLDLDPVMQKYKQQYEKAMSSGATSQISMTVPALKVEERIGVQTRAMTAAALVESAIQKRRCEVKQEIKTATVNQLMLNVIAELERVIRKTVHDAKMEQEAAQRVKEEQCRQQHQQAVKEVSTTMSNRTLCIAVNQQLMKLLKEEKRADFIKVKEEVSRRTRDYVWKSFAVPLIDTQVKHCVRKIYKHNTKMINEGLARFREHMHLLWLRQFWDTWRTNTVRSRDARIKRKTEWANFKPSHQSRMFQPSNYLKARYSDPSEKRSKNDLLWCTAGNGKLDVRVAAFIRKRRLRLTRDALARWQLFVNTKKREREQVKIVLHQAEMQRQLAASCRQSVTLLNRSNRARSAAPEEGSPRNKIPRLDDISWFDVADEFFDESGSFSSENLLDGSLVERSLCEARIRRIQQHRDEQEHEAEELKAELDRKRRANEQLERSASELAGNMQRINQRVQKLIALAEKQTKY